MAKYLPMPCLNCGNPYEAGRCDQQFCSRTCKVEYSNRVICRSRRIYEAAYHWRADRAGGADQLRELCREISSWIEEDKSQGRRPPPRFDPKRRGNVSVY